MDLSSPKDSPCSVPSHRFVEELKALKTAGFDFVSYPQVESFYLTGAPLPSRSILVTFGALNEVVQRQIRKPGYSLAFNVFGSNNDARADPLQLNRIIVLAADTPETVVEKASEKPLHFRKLVPRPLRVVSEELGSIEITLDRFKDYVPDSVRMLVNGIKPTSIRREGSRFILGIPAPEKARGYIATVYARKKTGELRSQSYYFLYAAANPDYIG